MPKITLLIVLIDCLAEAGSPCNEILYADFKLALARQKDFVYVPDRFETHWFSDRRTDLYGPLIDSELWSQNNLRIGKTSQVDVGNQISVLTPAGSSKGGIHVS
jgi:hypothetical protein